MPENRLTVRFFEKWQSTSYIEQLESHLIKAGVHVWQAKRERFFELDIVHLHIPHYLLVRANYLRVVAYSLMFFSLIGIFKLCKKRLVWTAHDLEDQSSTHPLVTSIWILLLARSSDFIFCHGQSAQKILVSKYGANRNKIDVSPHPSYVGLFPKGISRHEARIKLGLEQESFIFLLFGNIRSYKGAKTFLSALDKLGDKDSVVLIAGAPDDETEVASLQDQAKHRKQLKLFIGEIPADELQIFFASADVAILPYVRATTSGAVLMAMSFACPILGANHNCLGEMILPEGGIKYDPNDPKGLENAIVKMKSLDISSLHKMGAFNFEYASTLTWENYANRVTEVYRELLT